MKKNNIQKLLDISNPDICIFEIMPLSSINTLYWVSKDKDTNPVYQIVCFLKGNNEKNYFEFKYKKVDDIIKRVKKILYFMVNKPEETLVVTNNGIFLSSEIDFSKFNLDDVYK